MNKPIEPVYRALGARIEAIRNVLRITQAELANKVHMTRGSVANLETGRQRLLLHDVEVFASALGTNCKTLMRGIWF